MYVLKNIYFLISSKCLCNRGHICQRWGQSGRNSFSSRKWKHSECLWATVEEQDRGFWPESPTRSATALTLTTLPPHFRHSSLILKTMMVMSSVKRIVVRSVTVIYTDVFARTWCNTGCLFEEQILNFIGRSAINVAYTGVIFLWHNSKSMELVLQYFFFLRLWTQSFY